MTTRHTRALLALMLALSLGACNRSGAPAVVRTSAQPPGTPLTANEVLQKLLVTYRDAQTYSDDAVVLLEYKANGEQVSEDFPTAVKFMRPNRLSVEAFQATIKCDGKELRARIEDPLTGDVDNQMLVRPAPPELKLADLAADPLLYDILSSRLQRQPIQLELLLESGGLASAFGSDAACKLLDQGMFEGRACQRVEVPSPGGAFVFWVDEQDSLLRKLEYPAAALVPELAQDPEVSELRLVAELRAAKVGATLDGAQFTLAIPPGAKRMKTFVIPPPPLPSALFGKQLDDFFFTDAGARLSSRDLRGKIVVLAWFHDHPACAATLAQVDKARLDIGDNPSVRFFAVATDPASVATPALQGRLAEWQVKLPLLRDLEAFGDSVFKIEMQPTVTVLDQQGRLQIFQTRGSPELANQLAVIVERLTKGDDIAADVLARAERERAEYEKLVAAGGPEPGQVIELPQAVIKQRSEPQKLKLAELWTNRELKSPGNIYVLPAQEGPPRILVFEGWRTIAELDAEGKIAARHTLDLPEQAAVTYLRTAADRAGRQYYAAAAPLAPQLFLFDQEWKLIRSYPSGDREPLKVCDMQLADLDDDGVPEILAGYVDLVGLHAVSIDGKLLWRSRSFPNVISIAASPPNDVGSWSILLTGDSGELLRVNKYGNADPPITVKNWPLIRIAAASFANARQATYLAISSDSKGNTVAVGLDAEFAESWNYPLPAGSHQKPIEPIVSTDMLPGQIGQWLLAGPDGSVHILGEDGNFHDFFHCGAALNGLAASRFGDKAVILLATDEGVTAWEVK